MRASCQLEIPSKRPRGRFIAIWLGRRLWRKPDFGFRAREKRQGQKERVEAARAPAEIRSKIERTIGAFKES
jgi:hypothetical protein